MSEEHNTESETTTLTPLAGHFKRKYEAECQESLALAIALEDAVKKNRQLSQMVAMYQQQLQSREVEIEDVPVEYKADIKKPKKGINGKVINHNTEETNQTKGE